MPGIRCPCMTQVGEFLYELTNFALTQSGRWIKPRKKEANALCKQAQQGTSPSKNAVPSTFGGIAQRTVVRDEKDTPGKLFHRS